MTTSNTRQSVSRRTALAGLGVGGLGLALAATTRRASAQDAAAEMARHPIVGAWNAIAPGGPSLSIFHADGTATFADAPNYVDATLGVVHRSTSFAVWEPTGVRTVHFTANTVLSDSNGTLLGYLTVDGYPEVNEDGESLHDDESQLKITIRDAAGAVIQELYPKDAPPVTGQRVRVGSPGFPASPPVAATPSS